MATQTPLSTLLKKGTADAHHRLEHMDSARWLSRGELDQSEYARYLMMLWHIYALLEAELQRHANHRVLAPIFNPDVLARAVRISSDLDHLLGSWQSVPTSQDIQSTPPPALRNYLDRLKSVSQSQPALLLAHAYVRYLGDLSGGQYIKYKIKKAYNLDDEGLRFYDFSRGGDHSAGGLKKIKDAFKAGIDASIEGQSPQLIDEMVQEAVVAFDLNAGLFAELRPPLSTSVKFETKTNTFAVSSSDPLKLATYHFQNIGLSTRVGALLFLAVAATFGHLFSRGIILPLQ